MVGDVVASVKLTHYRNVLRRGLLQLVRWLHFRHFFMRDAVQFLADEVRRKSRRNQRPVQRSDLPLVNLAAESAQFSLNPLPDYRRRVSLFARGLQRHLDMTVRHSPGPQIPCDAKRSLFSRFRAMSRELLGIPRVVQEVLPLQPFQDGFHQFFIFAAPRQRLLHFMHRMRAPHQDFDRGFVKLLLCIELSWFPKHTMSIEATAGRDKL